MSVHGFTVTVVVTGLFLVPGGALAKGASAVTVDGPHLRTPIHLRGGEGDPEVGAFAEASGFFPAMFGQSPDPMLARRPQGDLGPRYTATYVVPSGGGHRDLIRQAIYPYAEGGPVTYTAPGQSFFGSEQTRGGWFAASPDFKEGLVAAGLPRAANARRAEEAPPARGYEVVPIVTAVVLLVLAGAGLSAAAARRRSPRAAGSQ